MTYAYEMARREIHRKLKEIWKDLNKDNPNSWREIYFRQGFILKFKHLFSKTKMWV